MTLSFEKVVKQLKSAELREEIDQNQGIKKLDPKQRKTLELFESFETVTASQIGALFGFKPRTSSALCSQWVQEGFLEIVDPSKKGRKYRLTSKRK